MAEQVKNTQLTTERRFEVLGAAAEFIEAARAQKRGDIDAALKVLEQAALALNKAHWMERAEAQLVKAKAVRERVDAASLAEDDAEARESAASLAMLAALLEEGEAFGSAAKAECGGLLIRLNQEIVAQSRQVIDRELATIKHLDGSLNDELFLQLLGAKQGQYLQLLTQVLELSMRYPQAFDADVEVISKQIAALDVCISGKKDSLQADILIARRLREEEYEKWADRRIWEAMDRYYDAKKVADKFDYFWGSGEVQVLLQEAYEIWCEVHPDDLHVVNPKLVEKYKEAETLMLTHLEKERKEKARQNTKFKRIEDMQITR